MQGSRTHTYQLQLKWTGNTGSGTASYTGYNRSHELRSARGYEPILMSSDAQFRGDPSRYNPEQLLVASLSSCHMLWFLHLCAKAGLVVTEYSDQPAGTMVEHEDGSGEFTEVILRPSLKITDEARTGELANIHHKAHELCFISRSVNFPVSVQPVPSS